MSETGNRFERITSRAFVMLVAFGVFLLLAEGASRYLLSPVAPIERQFPVGLVRVTKPYVGFGGQPGVVFDMGGGQTLALNRGGYPGPDAVVPKDRAEYRIAVVGGSTVFNIPSVPAAMERELQERGWPNVRVYNFGVVSSISGMDLARTLFEVLDSDPDLVVFYNGGNDILHPFYWDPRPDYPMNFIAYENNPLLERTVEEYPLIPLVAYGSNLARYAIPGYFTSRFTPLERERQRAGWGTEAWRQEIARIYVANLVKAQALCKGQDVEFLAFFQPMLPFKSVYSPQEEALRRTFAGAEAHCLDLRAKIQVALSQAAQEDGLSVRDLSGLFEGRQEGIFTDLIHITPAARAEVAAAISELIEAEVLGARQPEKAEP